MQNFIVCLVPSLPYYILCTYNICVYIHVNFLCVLTLIFLCYLYVCMYSLSGFSPSCQKRSQTTKRPLAHSSPSTQGRYRTSRNCWHHLKLPTLTCKKRYSYMYYAEHEVYRIAGNFHLEKIFANFAFCSPLSQVKIFLSCEVFVPDYIL